MSRTIWKFPLRAAERQALLMPKGADILTVQTQRGEPCVWAIVDPEAQKEQVEIRIHGTGHELPMDSTSYHYIGTYQIESLLVFHVFRMKTVLELFGGLG